MEWLMDHQPVIFERQNNAQCNQSLYQCTKNDEKHHFFLLVICIAMSSGGISAVPLL